jgi:TonB family protein
MFSTKPVSRIIAALLLSAAVPAMAAGSNVARIDTAGCEKPHFPVRWQNEGDSGSVVVGYLIGTDGKVMESKIVASSGMAWIDRASERAGARCRFQPAEGSSAAATWTTVKYSWTVD